MSETKVIIIIVLLFIIAVLPFPTGLLIYKFKSAINLSNKRNDNNHLTNN